MRPVEFTCSGSISLSPREICEEIARVDRWSEFEGYGLIPGIRHAQYEVQTPAMIGSRIRVLNEDGSSHTEEIVSWYPGELVRMRLREFSPPLDRIADHFFEEWRFSYENGRTEISRSFSLHAQNGAGRILLWLISWFLRRAVSKHLRQMSARATAARGRGPD